MRAEFSDRRKNIIPPCYLHLPTIDNTPPTLEQLYQGVEFMKKEIDEGGKVYVHCWEGIGRGPTMVAAYLIKEMAMTADEAWKHIRKVRPFIRPTGAQVAQIERFAADVAQKQAGVSIIAAS
jgi:dual specificity MAP kinase phosphatase